MMLLVPGLEKEFPSLDIMRQKMPRWGPMDEQGFRWWSRGRSAWLRCSAVAQCCPAAAAVAVLMHGMGTGRSVSQLPYGKALYTYEGKEPGDLKFNKGDIIILRRKVDENWYHGELNGNHGFFPASYIQCIKPLPQAPPQGKALYDFEIKDKDQDKDCLTFTKILILNVSISQDTFLIYDHIHQPDLAELNEVQYMEMLPDFIHTQKDEILTVIRRVDDNWAEGMLGDKIGIFPILYVEDSYFRINAETSLPLCRPVVPPPPTAACPPAGGALPARFLGPGLQPAVVALLVQLCCPGARQCLPGAFLSHA
ncbi:hypothetical protein Nmel_002268 [Mimus melanotis]